MTLAYPAMLLLILPVLLWLFVQYGRSAGQVRFSITRGFLSLPRSPRWHLRNLPLVIHAIALLLLVIAAARPQVGRTTTERKSEGLDIVLAVDTSGSMRALDLKLNGNRYDRLTVVKNVIKEFIEKRVDDRIGMVVFGSEAFTQAPLTLDHEVLFRFLGDLEIEMAGPATAIGDGLVTATKRLKDLKSKSKVVILLTDGENTAGNVSPDAAAQAAATLGVKVYTIGVGSNGLAPMPVRTLFGTTTQNVEVRIDEKVLQAIADKTGGKSFLASNTEALRKVYATIDKLEKTEVEVREYVDYKEAGYLFMWPALFLMLFDLLMGLTRLRRIP